MNGRTRREGGRTRLPASSMPTRWAKRDAQNMSTKTGRLQCSARLDSGRHGNCSMSSLVDTPDRIENVRAALARAVGYPVRGRVFRRDPHTGILEDVTSHPVHDKISPIYLGRGTPGWIDNVCAEPTISDDGTIAAVEIPPEAAQFLGQEITLADGATKVRVPQARDLIEEANLPAKIKAVKDRESAAVEAPK
jgi:hypothetical protein